MNKHLIMLFFVLLKVIFERGYAAELSSSSDKNALQASPSLYTEPGIIAFENGRWLGSDNLLNLSKEIGYTVEITAAASSKLDVNSFDLNSLVFNRLNNGGIKTGTIGKENIPLPLLYVSIFILPFQSHFSVFCELSLFEKVQLDRVHLLQNISYQAITWRQQEAFTTSDTRIIEDTRKNVSQLLDTFISRFQFYDKLRTSAKSSSSS